MFNGKHQMANNLPNADDSQKSFVFALKIPHNIPARKFLLMTNQQYQTIYCNAGYGPSFGYGHIVVSDNCTANIKSATCLGDTYSNDTGLDM
jgi:hypothetical protein